MLPESIDNKFGDLFYYFTSDDQANRNPYKHLHGSNRDAALPQAVARQRVSVAGDGLGTSVVTAESTKSDEKLDESVSLKTRRFDLHNKAPKHLDCDPAGNTDTKPTPNSSRNQNANAIGSSRVQENGESSGCRREEREWDGSCERINRTAPTLPRNRRFVSDTQVKIVYMKQIQRLPGQTSQSTT